jgi:baculoviral IAP repeat-containing protein 7/8
MTTGLILYERMGLPNVFSSFGRLISDRDITDNSGEKREKQHMSETSKPGPSQQIVDLNVEANRLRTFENWNVPFIDKHQLALLGFYYYGPNDMVKCYFCGVEVGMWEEGDDVLTDHSRWSPSCSFIRRRPTNNVPIDEALLNQTLPPIRAPDVYGAMERLTNTVSEGPIESISEDDVHMRQHQLFEQGGIEAVLRGESINSSNKPTLLRPEHPDKAVEAKRIESFADWPKTIKQRPKELSDAGFFYTGYGDKVLCFSCNGGLKDWEENDDPWEQHAMWYGNCEYLKLMKGEEFVKQMEKKRDEMFRNPNVELASQSSSQSSTSSARESFKDTESNCSEKAQEMSEKSDEEEEKKDSKLCKICYSNEYNTIFLPCGHVIACAKCASSVTKCPACRQPFEKIMRVYFS